MLKLLILYHQRQIRSLHHLMVLLVILIKNYQKLIFWHLQRTKFQMLPTSYHRLQTLKLYQMLQMEFHKCQIKLHLSLMDTVFQVKPLQLVQILYQDLKLLYLKQLMELPLKTTQFKPKLIHLLVKIIKLLHRLFKIKLKLIFNKHNKIKISLTRIFNREFIMEL